MNSTDEIKEKLVQDGFAVVDDVYTGEEVNNIVAAIETADCFKPTFRRSEDLFAIRQFLKEVPASATLIFNQKLSGIITQFFGDSFFVVKSIYFDKPGSSNWFVSYHQDLTISVDCKVELEGFGPWTTKQGQFAVQPPLAILEDNFTIRIHLDSTDENNGALHVIPQSHQKGLYRPETINWETERETVCAVAKGGVMLMKPLLLHASGRTINHQRRRVIHIEFSRSHLPAPLQWSEFLLLN